MSGGRAADEANKIVADEVLGFRRRLMAERVIPTVVALRQRLEELCQQEVEFLRKEYGPFTDDQDQVLTTLASHITQRIAGSLARELQRSSGPHRAGHADRGGASPVPTWSRPNLVEAGKEN